MSDKEAVGFDKVFADEKQYLYDRRKKLDITQFSAEKPNLVGIALSGGGIRSAITCLGFLNCLNQKDLFKFADYISSVSGGGYINSYIQTKLYEKKDYKLLFSSNKGNDFISGDNKTLRDNCGYLIPRKGIAKIVNFLRALGAVSASFLMNLFWLFFLVSAIIFLVKFAFSFQGIWNSLSTLFYFSLCLFTLTVIYHYFFFVIRKFCFWSSNVLNYIEGVSLIYILIYSLGRFLRRINFPDHIGIYFPWHNWKCLTLQFCVSPGNYFVCMLFSLLLFIILGFFVNPNILSIHRFYRDRLGKAFISPFLEDKNQDNFMLSDVINEESKNPYPLFNTCLNITDRNSNHIAGDKGNDYFLLSPKFCGSKLTGYRKTNDDYKNISIATAVASSGAAMNTIMGIKVSKYLSFFIYLFNLKLGYYIKNPDWSNINPFKYLRSDFLIKYFTFWPYYLSKEMIGKAHQKRGRINISDGGHIENLGVYELLKRRCTLIISIDAAADPAYQFADLTNLVVRAREMLGLDINFITKPEDIIKPSPCYGFSQKHYAKAEITCIDGAPDCDKEYKGTIIFIKSSLLAANAWKQKQPIKVTLSGEKIYNDESQGFHYKMSHPAFPHETTANQFFDEQKWDAYYYLGRKMCETIFTTDDLTGIKQFIDYCNELH